MRRSFAFLLLASATVLALVYLGAMLFVSRRGAEPAPVALSAEHPADPESLPPDASDAVPMEVKGVGLDPSTATPMVILVDRDDRRALPIFIGPSEATAIARQLGDMKISRPLTHDLILSIVGGLGARLKRVLISDIREGTYYAVLFLEDGGEEIPIDSRPSDAIAVALKADVPIFVAQKVLSDAPPFNLDDLQFLTSESERGEYVAAVGLAVQDLTPDIAKALGYGAHQVGALVAYVDESGPARTAGIEVGDVIVSAGAEEITSATSFRALVREHHHETVRFQILRDGDEREASVDLGE